MRLIEDGTCVIDVSEADLDKIKRVMLDTGKHCILMYPDKPERKKGKWIKEDSIYETVTCSVCHGVRRDNRINHINFCNCCGADMRGAE